ncbi:MAG: hypothetical protein WBO34_05810 [Gammaproteobacteria bacterium]
MNLSTRAVTLLLGLLLAGCATTWVKVDATGSQYQGKNYSARLPVGWMRQESDKSVVLSKDGVLLQHITIEYRPHEKAFEKIEKDSSASMLPSELAELTIAELKASQEEGLPSLEILHNAPFEIDGHTGFGIHLQYKTDSGLRMDMLLRGVADESGLYLIKYTAPTLHYFNRDRQVYDSLTESLQL